MTALVAIVGSFFLYLLLLPVFGFLICFTLRTLPPYCLGGLAFYLFAEVFLVSFSALQFWTVTLLWGLLVLAARVWQGMHNRKLGLCQGHYRSMVAVLTFGLLLRGTEDERLYADGLSTKHLS